jgi:hypothetical protein
MQDFKGWNILAKNLFASTQSIFTNFTLHAIGHLSFDDLSETHWQGILQ